MIGILQLILDGKKGSDISFATLPDLILIDGGIIQLQFAKESMDSNGLNIDMISLAEKNEEIYKIDGSKVMLSRDNFALNFFLSGDFIT